MSNYHILCRPTVCPGYAAKLLGSIRCNTTNVQYSSYSIPVAAFVHAQKQKFLTVFWPVFTAFDVNSSFGNFLHFCFLLMLVYILDVDEPRRHRQFGCRASP